MDNPTTDLQALPPHLDQKKLIGFLESLHRICKIGTYYPAGHAVLDQAAEQFQRSLGGVANTKRSVVIEIRGESVFVENVEIKTITTAIREFRKLLTDIGIGSMEIDRSILLPELLQLVKGLLLGRAQLQGIKQFTQADLPDLPTAVKVKQKEFLVDEGSIVQGSSDEDTEHGLNSVFKILAEQGLDRNQIEQCKRFLNSLADKFSGKHFDIKGLPSVTWTDVRSLLIRVVKDAYHLTEGSGGLIQNDLNALSSIFVGLEREVEDKEAKETINLLVSVFGRNALGRKQKSPTDANAQVRQADVIPTLSVEQLQQFVGKNYVHVKILEKITMVDRCEELSILLQLLQFNQEAVVLDKIRQNVRAILSLPLTEKEVEVLICGISALIEGGKNEAFIDTARSVTILLRNAKSLPSLQFLERLCQRIDPVARSVIWPVIVNELLAVGRVTGAEKAYDRLMGVAAGLADEEMKSRWQELEALDTFQEKKIAADIFDPAARKSYRFFSFLLGTSMKKAIAARILDNFRENAPDWLIEAVAPLLQLAIPQHMKFLQTYLFLAQQKEIPVNMRMAAGNLIVQHLPEISDEQKGEAWVATTIKATPEMQVEDTRQLLERIVEEKKMVVVPKWPNPCRKAAAEALTKLKRRPLTAVYT